MKIISILILTSICFSNSLLSIDNETFINGLKAFETDRKRKLNNEELFYYLTVYQYIGGILDGITIEYEYNSSIQNRKKYCIPEAGIDLNNFAPKILRTIKKKYNPMLTPRMYVALTLEEEYSCGGFW
ncbi:hypothetical protein ND861_19465 [Leptospira sp. 2 VSF19]|uniref:Rap1a immunity protein domain-containing protein n=1 Tax=Leptospira soteropolitanensis TaxID=2950025 RepID=A0AAW5VIR3_9LEPT|nr:hypothetical protein [Leptospira soteropolitanensis]MCW7494854.1 hypothetical protein [Leptospira soteropolitanensis]MCW7502428.1 hypothetical protein [Leptospira soteropolitanensis]MCW7524673.1 hypothetical protein [Leptospira soteropolitanensis]MCW7528544.1 hypothetical protein [Leptospira soteropolitanensis]MCW7532400.1 hypothetical protein [Leptospira soteropolitanensis]